MVSDEEIRKFMEKYYPEWANNLELGRILYEKFKRRLNNKGGSLVEKVKIGELEDWLGKRVIIEGVITDVNVSTYVGCPVCHRSARRGCEHLASGQVQESTIYRVDLSVADDTGSARIVTYPMNEEEYGEYLKKDIQVGDVIRVDGVVKKWKGKIEVSADCRSIELVRKVEVDIADVDPVLKDIISTLRKLKRVKKQIYESMCRSKGVNPQVLIEQGYVIENGDCVEVVKDE